MLFLWWYLVTVCVTFGWALWDAASFCNSLSYKLRYRLLICFAKYILGANVTAAWLMFSRNEWRLTVFTSWWTAGKQSIRFWHWRSKAESSSKLVLQSSHLVYEFRRVKALTWHFNRTTTTLVEGKFCSAAVRFKSCWHKDKESSLAEKWLVQCLCLSHFSVFPWYYRDWRWSRKYQTPSTGLAAHPLAGSFCLLVDESVGDFFQRKLFFNFFLWLNQMAHNFSFQNHSK